MRTFAAIDGGGTRSRLRVTDENSRILFESTGGSTNLYSVGFKAALGNLVELIGSFPGDQEHICIASAGLGREQERQDLKTELEKAFPSAHFTLCSDIEALIVGGLDSLEGAALVAGTGSIAMRRYADGHLVRRGGFGWRLGDEGSGWHIADQAVRRMMRSRESRDLDTRMEQSILKHFNVQCPDDLIGLFNSDTLTKSAVASLAPTVVDFASKGDELAVDILESSIRQLSSLVTSLFSETPCPDGYPLLLAGGVLETSPSICRRLEEELRLKGYEFATTVNTGRALEGALRLAQISS